MEIFCSTLISAEELYTSLSKSKYPEKVPHSRREEKLYVEGMEDEDMKKETQNLAYPPAFKLGEHVDNSNHKPETEMTSEGREKKSKLISFH